MERRFLLKKEDAKDIEEKRIICFGKSEKIISEMSEIFPHITENIELIVDNNKKVHGIISIFEKEIRVVGVDELENIVKNDGGKYAIVITSTYNNEIFQQLEQSEVVGKAFEEIYIFAFSRLRKEIMYLEKYKKTDLKNIIVFRSGPKESAMLPGMDFADNARALFEYMLEKNYDRKYKLVWFVESSEKYKDRFKGRNVEFVDFQYAYSDDPGKNDIYFENLFLAKYIFLTDSYGFASNTRKDQIRIQLWHGCGFKTRVNFASCEKRYEYNIVISDVYKNIHKKIYGLRDDQVVITGYPKQDWLRKPYSSKLSELLGVPEAEKYIFWLPTFRMADDRLKELNQYKLSTETSLPIVGSFEQLEILNSKLKEMDICLIIKFHPFVNKNQAIRFEYSNIKGLCNEDLVEKDLVINRLLAEADALISDYSSAAVDFLALDRPVAFTLDDVDEYKNSRGFVFDNIKDWIPGKELFNFDDMLQFAEEISQGRDSSKEKRERLTKEMNYFHDDQNSQRVLDTFNIIL